VSGFKPSAVVSAGVLTLKLATASGAREVGFDCVIDQTDLGDVVGIEILDLRQQLAGGQAPASQPHGFPRWSYDQEIDALYVRVADGRAQVQKAGSGIAYLDPEGYLSVLEVRVTL
jgi:uncharacterized protein YuzE